MRETLPGTPGRACVFSASEFLARRFSGRRGTPEGCEAQGNEEGKVLSGFFGRDFLKGFVAERTTGREGKG